MSRGRAVSALLGVVLLGTACTADSPRGAVFDAMRQRGASASRLQPPYRSLAELLPNTKYQWPDAKPKALIEAAVVGRISDVERGRGFYLPDGDAPRGTPTDFDDPRALWRTVHATVEVDQAIAGQLPAGRVVVGFAFGHEPPFEDIKRGLEVTGRVLVFLERSPVFDYADFVYGVPIDGTLLGVVDDDGRITLPAAEPADQKLLDGASTLQDLVDAARRPERVIRVDHDNVRQT